MKKTCFINGSPRGKNSGSQYLIKHLDNDLDKQDNKSFTIYTSDLQGKDISLEDFEKIISVDNIVFAFPLYVDSIPANLLDFLFKLEAFLQKRKEINKDATLPRIFAITNCGFIESKNNCTALQVIQHFCSRVGLNWIFGLGIGAGEFMKKPDNPLYFWMKKPVLKALSILKDELQCSSSKSFDNILVSPRMPVFVYNSEANKEWNTRILTIPKRK